MQGIDTNVLVRFILHDDTEQTWTAEKAIRGAVSRGETMLVSLLTILETEWVLRSGAGLAKSVVLATLKLLLGTRELQFEHEAVLEQAIYDYENGNADFADCLMVAAYQAAGCRTMLTFDRRAARLEGAELLPA